MKKSWWKESVIYQIYPRSFQDSNGDGIGDIKGIISRLDYLQNLGVDIIWLGPVYQSPNDDNGYDISDYYAIHPEFGTMEDFDELLKSVKSRGMKLIMDVVVNHSSDEHEWFMNAKKSKENEYRDFYIWKKSSDNNPPNNYLSFFGGSAWEYDETSEEYYLHLFTKKQPDLNWENPRLRKEIYKILKFWLDKGIDGFRMDVISLISKRLEFSSYAFNSFGDLVENVYANGPRIHEFIQEMYNEVFSNYDMMTVGEGPGISTDVGLSYVGSDRGELNMIFHLDHMFLGFGKLGRFDPVDYSWEDIKKIFHDWNSSMDQSGWVSIFLDNHDFPRMVSRFGNDKEYRVESAKLLAMLILTMRGTPCIYQGSEIGMTNIEFNSIEEFRDVETLNFYKEFTDSGISEEKFIELANNYGRDNVRTPIQWNGDYNSGFTQGTPWIEVNPNYRTINVEKALKDKNSIFFFYKELLRIRKSTEALKYGKWAAIEQSNPSLYVYKRWTEVEVYLIILNHSDEKTDYYHSEISSKVLVLSNLQNSDENALLPWECRLYQIKKI